MTKLKVDLSDMEMTGKEREILAPYFASTKANADGWIKMHCPIHGDANPSAGINVVTGWWRCQACGEGGSVHKLLARKHEWKPPDYERIVGDDPEWEPSTVRPTESLPRDKDLAELSNRLLTKYRDPLEYLQAERGIEPRTIERFSIGYRLREYGGEFVLPMRHDGALVNVRYYNPTRTPKILNHTGYGSIGLFPDNDIPAGTKLLIVEGEWDCYATMQRLEKYGYTVRTFTNGTGAIRKLTENNPAIKRILATEPSEIVTIFDCDSPGRIAAKHLSHLLPTRDVVLPYPITDDGGKDLTDYWQERRGRPDEAERQLLDLMSDDPNERSGNERSQPPGDGSPRRPRKLQGRGTSTPVREATRPRRAVRGKGDRPRERPLCPSLQSALTDTRFEGQEIRISNIEVESLSDENPLGITISGALTGCTKKGSLGSICDHCPRSAENKNNPHAWKYAVTDSPELVADLIERTGDDDHAKINEHLGMCTFAKHRRSGFMFYQGMRVNDKQGTGDTAQTVLWTSYLGDKIQEGGTYDIVCIPIRITKTTRKTLLVIDAEPVMQAPPPFPSIVVRPEDEPFEWVLALADSMALRHTHIFGNTMFHVVWLLLFVSPGEFSDGDAKVLTRGRLDILGLGETRSGKTSIARGLLAGAFGLSKHELESAFVSGEGVTSVGLTAAHDKIGNAWFISKGAFPLRHGKELIIDEVQAMPPKMLGELNTVRDEGVVRVTKVHRRTFQAQTRLGQLANPTDGEDGRFINSLPALYEQESARARFDLVVAAHTVDQDTQEQIRYDLQARDDLPIVSVEQMRWLRHKAQTIRPDSIVIPHDDSEFGRLLKEYVREYGETYSKEHDRIIRVMNPQTNRDRVLRCAVAFAMLTMSFDREYKKLLVTVDHLNAAVRLIDRVHGDELLGYADLMRELQADAVRRDKAAIEGVRILLDQNTPISKAALNSTSARRQARAFARKWNDPDFKIDMRSPEHGQWRFIADVLRQFAEDGVIEARGASNNYRMAPAFKRALKQRLEGEA